MYAHAKNQGRFWTVPEVMAECPLRGHPTLDSDAEYRLHQTLRTLD